MRANTLSASVLAVALCVAPLAAHGAAKKALPVLSKPPAAEQGSAQPEGSEPLPATGSPASMQADPVPAGAVGTSGSLQQEPPAGESAPPGGSAEPGVSVQAVPVEAAAPGDLSPLEPVAISGQIYDPRGRPLAGIAVIAVSGSERRQTFTDDQGNYVLWLLPGEWEVSANSLDYEFTPPSKAYRVADGQASRIR